MSKPITDTADRMAEWRQPHSVLEGERPENRPPEFSEETATEGTAMRMVAENAPSTTFVGEPLALRPWTPTTRKGRA